VSFNPFGLKWNFERHGRLSPYLELEWGAVHRPQRSRLHQQSKLHALGALGTHILARNIIGSLELRYLHISNAGLARINPGLNTLEFRLGVGKFFGGHR